MAVDLAAGLTAYLREAWGDDVEVANLSQSTAGARRHNVLFEATVGGVTRHLVATIVPFGETIINPIEAEAAVRDVAEKGGVAVPHVHLVRGDGELVGGPFMISEFVPGETVPRRVLRLVEEHGIGETVARQLGESLARLHAIDPTTVGVPLRTREHDGPPAVAALAGLRAAVDELPQRRPALELGLKWLERHLPDPPERETIVHSDTRNGNLIVGEDGLRAVLDWEGTLASGDPMQDVAWPALRMWRFRNDTKEVGGFAGREPFIEGYEGAGGTFDVERFHWWKVEGTARWAVGLAGQTMGFLEGRVPSIVMAASGRRVPELEWDLLMLIRP
jgi:aminoglycoside phosphotransferase (APT) family kinase protein